MGLSDLRHRLVLCRQDDVISSEAGFQLRREEVKTVLASVTEKSGTPYTKSGHANSGDGRTHIIMIRYRPSLNLSEMAWLYEKRVKSSPRWFKVLSIGQTEESSTPYWKINAKLVERSDDAPKPTNPVVVGLPPGVKL